MAALNNYAPPKTPVVKAQTLLSLLEKDLPPLPSWIEPAILPKGGTLVFGGLSKIGKSFVMLEMARCLATAARPFDSPHFFIPESCRVLVVEQELGEGGLQNRAKQIWQGDERVELERFSENLYYVSKVPEMMLSEPVGRRILTDLVNDIEPNVLILDPIGRLHSYDENDGQQIAQLFMFLEGLLKENAHNGMALMLSHHFKKPGKPGDYDTLDPYNYSGSAKFFNNPDAIVTMDRFKELKTPWKAWALKMRFTLRQGEAPNDQIFHVNEKESGITRGHGDGRVRYMHDVGQSGTKIQFLVPGNEKPAPRVPAQLLFDTGGGEL